MKLLILGATGRTGRIIIEEVVKAGHEAVAIARDPEKLEGINAAVVAGSPYDKAAVVEAMPGCDAVINTLNVSRTSDFPWAKLRAPVDLISRSAANALEAMRLNGVTRFVALGAIGAGSSRGDVPALMRLVVDHSNLQPAFEDHGRQEELLVSSDTDYTLARAPMLTLDDEDRGIMVKRPGESGRLKNKLGRRSVARFFIDIIENKKYIREIIGVSNAR